MSAFLTLVLLAPLLAGCGPGGARSDGASTADAPFTLTALDVGQVTALFRCMRTVAFFEVVPQTAKSSACCKVWTT